ncbi:MAG: formyltransferase family protein [Flavobacteriales bacterium]
MKKNIAVLASGKGSNAKNICAFFQKSEIVSVKLICSNKKNSPLASFSDEIGVNYYFLNTKIAGFFDEFINYTKALNVDFVVLAGFLLKVPKKLTDLFNCKIINIHPSLLPKYGGKGMYGMNIHNLVIKNKEKYSGITIHFVNDEYDSGGIIFQHKYELRKDETAESLAKEIQKIEHSFFPKIILETIKKTVWE